MNAWNQFYATTSATSNALYYPSGITVYNNLPSVVSERSEWVYDRDAKLSPVEWLRRQVDDVCALAVA